MIIESVYIKSLNFVENKSHSLLHWIIIILSNMHQSCTIVFVQLAALFCCSSAFSCGENRFENVISSITTSVRCTNQQKGRCRCDWVERITVDWEGKSFVNDSNACNASKTREFCTKRWTFQPVSMHVAKHTMHVTTIDGANQIAIDNSVHVSHVQLDQIKTVWYWQTSVFTRID